LRKKLSMLIMISQLMFLKIKIMATLKFTYMIYFSNFIKLKQYIKNALTRVVRITLLKDLTVFLLKYGDFL